MDTLSNTSKSAYVGRSKLQRNKSAVPSQRSGVSARSNTGAMKVYIPEEYYKHTGYLQKKAIDTVSKTSKVESTT